MYRLLGVVEMSMAIEVIVRLLLSLVVGALIGLDRSKRGSPAGLKTHALVCIGSCLVMLVAEAIYAKYGSGDIARMPAQVISGIGFLGAGTILVTQHNQIKGLTSAASIWFVACVGLAIGFGFYLGAFIAMVMEMVIVRLLSHHFQNTQDKDLYDLYLEHDETLDVLELMKNLKSLQCKIISVEKDKMQMFEMPSNRKYAIFIVEIPEDQSINDIVQKLQSTKGIVRVDEV